jgi:hypothetical protein
MAELKTIAGEITAQDLNDNFSALNSEKPYETVGIGGLKPLESLFLDNDNNLFGYDSQGNLRNIATIQQNDITDLGNPDLVTWIRAKNYASVRAPKLEIVTQSNPDGTGSVPAREFLHQGNACHHAIFGTSGSGTQTLTQSQRNELSILGSVVSQYPSGSATSGTGAYVIPRNGVYMINIVAKISTAITQTNSYLRFGIKEVDGATSNVSYYDMEDKLASSSYGTPFIGCNFMYPLGVGDVITPFVNPLNENLTIGAGTKFNVYFMGDRP